MWEFEVIKDDGSPLDLFLGFSKERGNIELAETQTRTLLSRDAWVPDASGSGCAVSTTVRSCLTREGVLGPRCAGLHSGKAPCSLPYPPDPLH